MTDNPNDVAQPLVAHLKELRDRLIKTIIVVIAVFAVLYYFANDLYVIVSKPLERLLPENIADVGLIATGVTSPFLVPLKLTLVTAVFIAIPFILHQTWGFIAPALYKHEKKFAVPLLISSVLLFYCGIAFAYFVVLPIIFGFFAAISIEGIAYLPDISNVLDFILKIFFAFGIAFEIPIATFLMVWAGIVEIESLRKKRPYIFVGCFAVGMLVTPPDIFSQTILAVPMWLLFEIGLIFSRFAAKNRASNTASAEN
ncbi:twin-arginine translocase subunit TatC [Gynuella sp.]|uniref:twin-arginine translocase subunit TatC n=1 Tax=Gynuella sp. TaxID=2969146 RepID=UPI003D0FEE14